MTVNHEEFMEGFIHHLTLMACVCISVQKRLPENPSEQQMVATRNALSSLVQSWVNECFQLGISGSLGHSVDHLTRKYNDWLLKLSHDLQSAKTSTVFEAPKNDPVMS